MQRIKRCSVCLVALLAFCNSRGQDTPLILTGDVTGAQHQTYFEVPFTVPSGIHRISVDFHFTGKEQRAALDLGIFDPERFRGESGGNKTHFTIAEADATPSYLPGAIPAGQWHLLIAVPNMRPSVVSHYTAEIRFNQTSEDTSFTDHPLAVGTRWYRGDLHMHTGHSDGSCRSQQGVNVPCPLFLTVQAAAAGSLDFIAITDHNSQSQYQELREMQPFFDRLLLIPGREMTTFHGHFNIFGTTQYLDWQIGQGRDLNAVLRDARAMGAVASINHANAPEGEECMGCRWTPKGDTDMGLFNAVEVINNGELMFSSASFWDAQLRAGHRLAAVGGSDNHNATLPPGEVGAIGWPATAVEADQLSVPSILAGIRAGRTFIDLTASHDKVLDFEVEDNGLTAKMGGNLAVARGTTLSLKIHMVAAPGSTIHLLMDGKESSTLALGAATATVKAPDGRHYLRLEVHDASGANELISSPLYLNFPQE